MFTRLQRISIHWFSLFLTHIFTLKTTTFKPCLEHLSCIFMSIFFSKSDSEKKTPRNCWVHVSSPLLTLDLQSFTAAPQLALVAGGTGIAPLAQILSHCVAGGILERCQVMLLYSSRTLEAGNPLKIYGDVPKCDVRCYNVGVLTSISHHYSI